jgi:putative endopeptidase
MNHRRYLASLAPVALVVALATALATPQVAQASTPAPSTPAPAATPTPAPAKATFGQWGVDLSTRDLSVKPGDDFQRYASGKWLDAATIPADRPSVGSFYDLREAVQSQLRDLITHADASNKFGALYASFLDETRVEAIGLAPLQADLAHLHAITSKHAFARYMGETNGAFGSSIVDFDISPDTADANLNALWVGQSGLGMPDRDYYLTAQFQPQREAYAAYIERVMRAIGTPQPEAAAKSILAFETAVAKVSWAAADRRDIARINNPYSTAQLAAYAPGLDWQAFFAGAGIPPQKRMIVNENSAIRAIAALYAQTPLSVLKQWQAFHVADQASPYLGKAMVDSRFAYTKTISGVTEIRPRWKRGVDLVDGSLGELVGQAYVERYFPPAAKAKMEVLVGNLKAAMAGRIAANGWMSADTKQAALTKLAKMDVMVGYPDKWRDYTALTINPADLYGNAVRAGKFNAAYHLADLGKPVDHKKWGMNPQTVNAYNGELENKIVFPAGILQPPFFDPNADDAANYGAIGAVIGHEISHAFDDQGRKIDANGNVRDWWTADDAKRFEAETKVFGDQYAKFEAVPGAFVNPGLTMGENIADFAGVQVALDAYHRSLAGQTPPVLDGLTGEQRFFLAFAQVWRSKSREAALRNQVTTDPHSPPRFRVLGPLRNVDAWYQAFGVKPGDTMYIPPEGRAKIW